MKTDRPDYTPGVQAGNYEEADAANVAQEVEELNSLQAGGDKEMFITEKRHKP